MKTIFLALSFFIFVDCFSQVTVNDFTNLITVDDLGFKTHYDVFMEIREEVSLIPCESITAPMNPGITRITYCVNDKDKISYSFYNENLFGVSIQKKVNMSKQEVENLFKKVTTEKKLKLGIEPKLLNYGDNGEKGMVRYPLTPAGEPDLFKIPLFNKDIASKMSEVFFKFFNGNVMTNLATFNTSKLNFSFGIMAKFSENELFFFEAVSLQDYMSEPPLVGNNP